MRPDIGSLLKEFDGYRDQVFAREGVCITCQKGCHACCSEPLYTTRAEAEHLWSQLTAEQMEELKPKLSVWIETWEGSAACRDEIGSIDVIEYRRLKLACPLLVNGLCSVYEHRPIGCRDHCAVGPREYCEIDRLRKRQRFISVPKLLETFVPRIGAQEDGRIEWTHLGIWLGIFAGVIPPGSVHIEDLGTISR
jgi:Fe-S-cluster containining protein